MTALHRFPVKSCSGEELDAAEVEPWGLAGDRHWMLVDPSGETVTARAHPRMLLMRPRLSGDGLVVSAPERADLDDLEVATPQGPLTDVTVFGRAPFAAALADDSAHAWFSDLLDTPVRLVHADDPRRRHANPAYAGPNVPMAFADGYPLNVGSLASLAELNRLIAEGPRAAEGGLEMVRFRPNLVVDGEAPWAEDGWRRIRVGEVVFRVVKGCDRCAVPATDHRTAERFKEPTATLARHRRWDGAVWFGVQLVPDSPATGAVLRVGDEVEVLEAEVAPDGPPR
ncbi:MOSC domain-containing protein [Nocardioides sp. YIM 123512]|uniref:MOSC domain-containing protein n=1 Tax=Nocardioides flavescens TaxID=2691959 RepID=A0A6L7F116_9ACTN|nr:MOSC N-terminal beta barrel domain-containing protein [Nocardioides flavescens]MXG90709.1 MOSC domain-containing protein [Nocardioides flavescens]